MKCDVLMSSVSITHTFGKVMKDTGKNTQMQIIALPLTDILPFCFAAFFQNSCMDAVLMAPFVALPIVSRFFSLGAVDSR